MAEFDDQALDRVIELAREAGQARQQIGPLASRVRYNHRERALMIYLNTGYAVMIPVRLLQGLADAEPEQLRQVTLSPSRMGIHFTALDADFTLDGLLEGIYGTERWMQSLKVAAAKGGSARTEAKRIAARENGKKGGRPKVAEAKASQDLDAPVR
jgi:hypothetical protein